MRLAFVTDQHIGATKEGFQQQPRWVQGTRILTDHLVRWADRHEVDMFVFGGDLIDSGSLDEIKKAVASLSRLSQPSLVCLGNHDLAHPQALGHWQRELDGLANAHLADTCLELDQWVILALNNYWIGANGPALCWNPEAENVASLHQDQLEWLHVSLLQHANRPAIVVVHAPTDPLPPELTGYDHAIHSPPAEYSQSLNAVLDRHTHVKMVLSGHCHVTCAAWHRRRIHLTTAALSEIPFQLRFIDLHDKELHIQTVSMPLRPEGVEFDQEKDWVVGRKSDQEIRLPIDG